MGLARLNRPGVFVYGGTIQPGKNHTDIVSVFEAVGKRANNDINDVELEQIESTAIPGPVLVAACILQTRWLQQLRHWV